MRSALIAAIVAAAVASGSTVAATRLIDGNQIRPHTISESKLTAEAIAALRGQQGPPGTNGTSATFSLVRGPDVVVPPSDGTDTGYSLAQCPQGSYPVAGGYVVTRSFDAEFVVPASAPDTADGKTADGWGVLMGNLTALGATQPVTFHAWATCETGGGPITLPG